MPTTNGNGKHPGAPAHPPTLNAEERAERLAAENQYLRREMVNNAFTRRMDFIRDYTDPRRDLDVECGYPKNPTTETYQQLYERDAIAARVAEIMPKLCWQNPPTVYEEEDSETPTAWEAAWDDLGRSLRGETGYFKDEAGSAIWDYLLRADILSGIGQYGIILLGLNDGRPLNEPVEGVEEANSAPAGEGGVPAYSAGVYSLNVNAKKTTGRKLLYLRVFPESLAEILRWEANPTSPRFGQPIMYGVTLADPRRPTTGATKPGATVQVHWTRVIHVPSDGLVGSCETLGTPRMQAVLNNILNLRKVYGGDPEAYWKNCRNKLILETPDGNVDVNTTELKDEIEKFDNGTQPHLWLAGMAAKTLPPAVVDPTPHVNIQIEAICIKEGIPKRKFMGSERGELASGQDDGDLNDVIRGRQRNRLTPLLVAPLCGRLILVGVLPPPKQLHAYWPDYAAQSDSEKVDIATKKTQAMSVYVGGDVQSVMAPMDFLTRVLGYTEEEADAILKNSAEAVAKAETEAMAKQAAMIEQGLAPDPAAPTEGEEEEEESPFPALNALADNNCGIGPGGFQPGNTCAGGGAGGAAPAGGPGSRKNVMIGGKAVTLEIQSDGAGKVVAGPPDMVGRVFRRNPVSPAAKPPDPPPAEAKPGPAPKTEPPKAAAPAAPRSFRTNEEAEAHFSATLKTNLRKGKTIGDAEYRKQAAHVAEEFGRLGQFKGVKATLKKRTSRGQGLELGTDFDADTGSAAGAAGAYKFGEGIRLSAQPVSPNAAPQLGQYNVGGDLGTTFRHELGHEVFQAGFSGARRSEWTRLTADLVGTATVSRYGGTNSSELFSEAFAAYTSRNYRRGSLPSHVERFMDQHVRG